ncbi:PepSY domain-containing protein [Luteimonas huabeiensis]|uniref:PepSY domain-containing protein n=1 Tax=Luteimonas huabeiensis TaxID=1244513 RepID=UPI0004BB926C|nr:PepSY domain-containing protein [Luteimonas huabeiensis]
MRLAHFPLALAALLFAAPLAMPLRADPQGPRGGADYARDGVRSGEFVRLERLLADAERRYPGRVIEVELDQDDDEYEIEILMGDGRVAELKYDARSGRLLEVEIDD